MAATLQPGQLGPSGRFQASGRAGTTLSCPGCSDRTSWSVGPWP